jgi:BirA family transcriptional regulator, biotin operon repressor / biotin---[acetyl-CoA-carboxylase] ligase
LSLGLAANASDQIDGFRLEEVGVVSSTSDLCLARARLGAPDGLSILAEAQSAGRGSRGRAWSSPIGNLYLSVLQRLAPSYAVPGDVIGGWSLLSGLALLEALEACGAESAELSLKWPNDILSQGAKLAGVLVEGAFGTAIDWLVIGFGANLAIAPEIPGRETAALGYPTPTPGDVTRALLPRLATWRRRLEAEGLAPVREAWLARAHPLGTAISVQYGGGQQREGFFAGLSPQGKLLLQCGDNLHVVSTGDVLLSGQGNPKP